MAADAGDDCDNGVVVPFAGGVVNVDEEVTGESLSGAAVVAGSPGSAVGLDPAGTGLDADTSVGIVEGSTLGFEVSVEEVSFVGDVFGTVFGLSTVFADFFSASSASLCFSM